MTLHWRKLIHLLELTRIELVFASVSNAWMVVFLSAAVEPVRRWNPSMRELPLWVIVLLSTATAAGLSVYGIALNDVLDVRRDRAFAPTRPIPAGRVALPVAVVVSVLALLLAMAAAVMLGRVSALVALIVAGAILFYNATGKHLPAVGTITLGLIHAGAAMAPNPTMAFTWPVWLILTHVMLYAAVTYRLEGKRPRLTTAEATGVVAGWAFVTLVLVTLMTQRNALRVVEGPGIWVGPIVATVVYLAGTMLIFRWERRGWERGQHRPRRAWRHTAGRYGRWAVLCGILMDAGWLAGAGWAWAAMLAITLAVVAFLLRRLIELLGHLAEPPPGYRLGPSGTGADAAR